MKKFSSPGQEASFQAIAGLELWVSFFTGKVDNSPPPVVVYKWRKWKFFRSWNIKIRQKRKSEVRVWTAAAVVMDEVGAWQTIGEVCMYVGMRT